MMNLKIGLLVIALATLSVAIDEFKNPRQLVTCIGVCKEPISACLKDHESACAKAYVQCHSHKNFLTCIESANGIMMQDIGKCMRKQCKSIQESEETNQPVYERGDQFRKFKRAQGNILSEEKSDDIEETSQDKASSAATGPSKDRNGNRL